MANPYSDPRAQMARLMAQGSSGANTPVSLPTAPSKAGVALGRAASNFANSTPSLREMIGQIQTGTQKAEPKGVFGALLGNPVAKTVLAPLEALNMVGRSGVAVAREIADIGTKDFNLGDIPKNIKDPTFGFGKAFKIDTGSKWIDRAIGLAGDIVLDPTTYLSFGAGKVAGYAGRLDLAQNVLKITGDEALANAVQRFGRSAIKDEAILELAGANRHGLYFLGKRTKLGKMNQGLRIPGTGAIGQLGEAQLAKLRVITSNTKAGKFLQRITLPGDARVARQALLQGEVGDKASATIISYLTASPKVRMAAAETLNAGREELMLLFKRPEAQGIEAISKDIIEMIENPTVFAQATPELQSKAQMWIDFFGGKENDIVTRLNELDPNATEALLANYFPRMQSEAAFAYRSNPSNRFANSLNEIYARDPLAGGNNFKTRTMQPGDDWFGHTLTVEDLASTTKLNKIANDAGFVGDFFETDIRRVANKYVESYAQEVGMLTRHKHLLDTGFWENAQAVETTGEIFDKEFVASMKKQVKTLTQDLRKMGDDASKAYLGMENALKEAKKLLEADLSGAQRSLDELSVLGNEQLAGARLISDGVLSPDAMLPQNLEAVSNALNTVAGGLDMTKRKLAEFFGAEIGKDGKIIMKEIGDTIYDTPLVGGGLIDYVSRLEEEATRLFKVYQEVNRNLTGKELADALEAAGKDLADFHTSFVHAQQRLETTMTFGNALESAIQAMIDGTPVDNMLPQVQHAMHIITSGGGVIGADKVRALLEDFHTVSGDLQSFIRSNLTDGDTMFKSLTALSPLNVNPIAKMSYADFVQGVSRMYEVGTPVDDIRSLAFFALSMDERLYSGNIPDVVRNVREQLITELRRADESIAIGADILKMDRQGGRVTSRSIWENQIKVMAESAQSLKERQASIDHFLNNFGDIIKQNPDSASILFNRESMKSQFNRYPWLEDLFGPDGEDWLSLMGANDYVPTPRTNPEFLSQQGKNVSYGVNTANIDEATIAGQATDGPTELTMLEILDAARTKRSEIQAMLDEPVHEFGSGSSKRMISGNELIQQLEEFEALKKEFADFKRERALLVEKQLESGPYAKEYRAALIRAGYNPDKLPDKADIVLQEADRVKLAGLRKIAEGSVDESVYHRVISPIDGSNRYISRTYIDNASQQIFEGPLTSPRRVYSDEYARLQNIKNEAMRNERDYQYWQVSDDAKRMAELQGYFKTADEYNKLKKAVESGADDNTIKKFNKLEERLRSQSEDMARKQWYKESGGGPKAIKYGDQYVEMLKRLDAISGGGNLVKPAWFKGTETAKSELTDALLSYVVVSDVHAKFNGLSNLTAAFGWAPNQRMFGKITDGVANRFLPQIESRLVALNNAKDILTKLDLNVAQAIRENAGKDSYTQVFRDALNGLTTKERDAIREAIGSQLDWTADPNDLRIRLTAVRKGKNRVSSGFAMDEFGKPRLDKNGKPIKLPSEKTIAENEFFEKEVKPWFQAAYPDKPYTKKDAIKALSKSTGTTSVFSQRATASDIKAFFEDIIGYSEIAGKSSIARPMTDSGTERWAIVGRGKSRIELKIDAVQAQRRKFKTLLAPDANIAEFFDNPGYVQKTPTLYASLLNDSADRLDSVIAAKQVANQDIIAARSMVNDSASVIAEAEQRTVIGTASARAQQLQKERADVSSRLEQVKRAIAGTVVEAPDDSAVNRSVKRSLEKRLKDIDKELTQAMKMPDRLERAAASGVAKTQAAAEVGIPLSEIDSELNALVSERATLTAKKRTAKGLTKKEEARLASVRKRIGVQRGVRKQMLEDAKLPKLSKLERDILDVPIKDRNIIEAEKIIDEYNKLTSSPVYVRAQADRELNAALHHFANYDLHMFTNGFTADGVDFATMPDGSRIVFNEAEWNSLFIAHSDAERTVARKEVYNVLKDFKSRVEALNGSIARDERILATARDESQRYNRMLQDISMGNIPVSQSNAPFMTKLYERISVADATIEDASARISRARGFVSTYTEEINKAQVQYDSLLKTNQKSALYKMKTLVEGRAARGSSPASPRIFDEQGMVRVAEGTHPTLRINAPKSDSRFSGTTVAERLQRLHTNQVVVDERRRALDSLWAANDSSAVLDKASTLEKNVFVRNHLANINDVASLRQAHQAHVDALNEAIRVSNEMGPSVMHTRTRAQEMAQSAIDSVERTTGLAPGAERISSFVDENGIRRFNTVGEQVDTSNVVDPESLMTSEDIRLFANDVQDSVSSTGPHLDRLDQAGSDLLSPERISAPYQARINELQQELNTLKGIKSPSEKELKRIKAIETRLLPQQQRHLNDALLYAEGPEAAAANYVDMLNQGVVKKTTTGPDGESTIQYTTRMLQERYDAAYTSVQEWTKAHPEVLAKAKADFDARALRVADAKAVMEALQARSVEIDHELAIRYGSVERYWEMMDDAAAGVASFKKQIETVDRLINSLPPKLSEDVVSGLEKGGQMIKPKAQKIIDDYRGWFASNKDLIDKVYTDPENPVHKAWMAAAQSDLDLISLQSEFLQNQGLKAFVTSPDTNWGTIVVQPFMDGWEKAAKKSGWFDNRSAIGAGHLSGLYGNKEAVALINALDRFKVAGVAQDMSSFMKGYTGFFRAYATLSPGFHVRNSISNIFSVFAAGGDLNNMRKGFNMWRSFSEQLKMGATELDNAGAIDRFVARLPDADKEIGRAAAQIVLGLGHGKVDNALEGFIRTGNKLKDNALLDFSRTTGHRIEGSARFMLAYDSLAKGLSVEEAFNKTRRYLIDYGEHTILDESMREIIPFWTWMSRNLPLQIMNRWANPKPYMIYEHFVHNFSQPESDGNLVPSYLKGAVNFGGGNVFAPDLPHLSADKTIRDIQDPRRLLSMVNPGVRIPMEMLTNQNTFTNKPFKNDYVKLDGALSAVQPLLELMGQVEHDARGNPVARSKAVYALQGMIPMLGQAERVMSSPGGLSSFFGSPMKNISQSQSDAEAYNRLQALQRLQQQQKNIGEAR